MTHHNAVPKLKWGGMKAWPVDFSGFTDADAIIARIDELRPRVMTGSEDLCWAAWEIEQLEAMLYGTVGTD